MRRIASILAFQAKQVERQCLELRVVWSQANKVDYPSPQLREQSLIRLAALLRQTEAQASRLRRDAAWFRGE